MTYKMPVVALAELNRLDKEQNRRLAMMVRAAIGLDAIDSARVNQPQCLIGLMAADLVRFRGKMPWAVSIATRIAEELVFAPDAALVHIEFHRNGASFYFTSDETPEAAAAAGPARFRLTFNLHEYRAVVAAAFAEHESAAGLMEDVEEAVAS